MCINCIMHHKSSGKGVYSVTRFSFSMVKSLCCVLVMVSVSGCYSLLGGTRMLVRHGILGTWEYQYEGKIYRREFTRDMKCITYCGRPATGRDGEPMTYTDNGEAYWIHDYSIIDERRLVVPEAGKSQQDLFHELLLDGRLNVENKHIGVRLPQ